MKQQLKPHPGYLVRERRKWGLSQEELGILLGTTKSAVCHFEGQKFNPSFKLVLATQIIFGLTPREAFPESFASVHEEVVRRAAKLDTVLRNKSGKEVEQKLKLLKLIQDRNDDPIANLEVV